jgi:hypothetical protein
VQRINDDASVSSHHKTQSQPLDLAGWCVVDNSNDKNTDAAASRARVDALSIPVRPVIKSNPIVGSRTNAALDCFLMLNHEVGVCSEELMEIHVCEWGLDRRVERKEKMRDLTFVGSGDKVLNFDGFD